MNAVRDLRAMLRLLHDRRDVVVIDEPVDPDQELAEIHRRVIAAGGPALFFRRVKGHDMPVVTNLFGTPERALVAFGQEPLDFVRRAVRLATHEFPPTPKTLWGYRDVLGRGLRLGTQQVRRPKVAQQVQAPARLEELPMIRQWPQDGGFFVTLPLVYTQHPDTGVPNLGMYRIQRHSSTTTGMHWQIGKGGGFHHQVAQERGEDLPVQVIVGGPPALILSAIAPLPENVPEILLASALLGEGLRVGRGQGPYPLMADAEVILEGRVRPHEVAPEGPFGDHYGYYSYTHDYPVFHVDRVYRRKQALWPATVVGKPRQEDLYIGDVLQELLSPLFPVVMPGVKDLWSYGETGYHSLAGAVVQERYGREAMVSALRILGEGQLSLTKFLWCTDQPVDLKDPREVLPVLLERFRPQTDLYVMSNLSMDTLDYTGPAVNEGSKAIMIGVGEPWRELPRRFEGDLPGGLTHAAVFCPGVLCVSGASHERDPSLAARVARALPDWPLIVVCDDAVRTAASSARFLWTTFTRMEPARDIHSSGSRVHRHHLVHQGAICIDARTKGGYAEEVSCDPDVAKQVTERWRRYFPDAKVEMGDAEAAHLDEG